MAPDYACPGCGAGEGTFHEHGCTTAPIGVRPCCHTPIWTAHESPHAVTCPGGWGENGPVHDWQFPFLGRDPWRGLW